MPTRLDGAGAAAYGWSADISDDEVLRELLALNDGGNERDAVRSGSRTARMVLWIPARSVVMDGERQPACSQQVTFVK